MYRDKIELVNSSLVILNLSLKLKLKIAKSIILIFCQNIQLNKQ